MKTPRFEKLVSFVPLAAVLIVTAIAGLASRAERVLANSEFMVAHTWEVITGLEHALGLVKDAETGARGYLITGDEHYVTAWATAASLLPGELAHLEALVSDDPMQEQKMAEMAQVASSRMGMIASTVSVRRRQGQAAAFAVVARGDGLAEMERLRTLVVGLQESERGLLARRQKALARIRIEARATVAFAGALDLVFIIFAIGSLGYEHRLRHAASEASRRLAKLQAINDVGLAQLSVSEFTDEMLVRLRSLAEMDAVALCGWHETEISITAVNGVSIAPGTRMPVQPDGPLAESGSGNRAVRLHGRQVSRLGIAAFLVDLREQKHGEELLRRNEKLAAAGRLAASIAHEINNPLEAITNCVYLLEQCTLAEEPRRYVALVQQELARVSHITTQTLRFYRQSTRPAETGITALIETVLALYEARLRDHGIVVVRDFHRAPRVTAYEGEIRQVVANLVGNALDAMIGGSCRAHGGGCRLVLRLRATHDWLTGKAAVSILVADTGSGMSRATLRRIYEPFFSTKGVTGTGLGLWVSCEIITRHHGQVRVRSRQQAPSGTVFRLVLPVDMAPEAAQGYGLPSIEG